MNCDEVEELLGAYALDALPDAEARGVRDHLATCEEHAVKARELRAMAAQLPALAEPAAAPSGLRARVLDAIAIEARGGVSVRPRGIDDARRSRGRVQWPPQLAPYGWLAAAAVFVAAMGLLAWNLVLLNGGSDNDAQRFARAAIVQEMRSTTGGTAATMVRFDGEDKAVVMFDRAPLDSSKAYQVWLVTDAGAESVGVVQDDASGHVAAVVPFDPRRSGVFAVTIEPASGSAKPTSDPIFRTS